MPHMPSLAFHLRCLPLLLVAVAARSQDAPAWLPLREFTLELHAHWEQLTDTKYGFEKKSLVRDLAPAVTKASYGAEAFRPFLPPAEVAVGASWKVDAASLLPFLRQLHAGASIELHHDRGSGIGAHGAWACLRLLDATSAEIVLRAHGEFLIAGDGKDDRSSWFTPSQFRGRLSLDRESGRVVAFELAVPRSSANVDVNLAEPPGTICDIGCVPRLELAGGTFPQPAKGAVQISERDAERFLERRFYPFAELEWLDLPAARAASVASGKPLHVIALFGSLTDESC
ncbi:MAG TPA: hypothetical protein VFT55_07590 [Planctomycetota bacterium]|nr:hypothetical protein [Planctomycetota bacterium]